MKNFSIFNKPCFAKQSSGTRITSLKRDNAYDVQLELPGIYFSTVMLKTASIITLRDYDSIISRNIRFSDDRLYDIIQTLSELTLVPQIEIAGYIYQYHNSVLFNKFSLTSVSTAYRRIYKDSTRNNVY